MEKIVIVTHEFAPFHGGAAVYCEELGAALRRAGREVDVWAPRLPGSLRLRHLIPFGWDVWRRRAELRECTVLLGSSGAHRVFMFLRLDCSRLFSLLHGSELLRGGKRLERFLKRVRCVFTPSEYTKSLVPDGVKVVVAPPAPSHAVMRSVPASRRDGRLRILTLARIHPRKGQIDVARALASLGTDVVYQCAGTGDDAYRREVEQACRDGGVAFEYLGEIPSDRLATTYAQCDIFVMASRSLAKSVEGFGIAYLEAAVHGKPVVGYRSGGAVEAVIENETGLLVDEGDVAALADALCRLITDSALRRRLGEAGHENATRFDWDRTASLVLSQMDDGPHKTGAHDELDVKRERVTPRERRNLALLLLRCVHIQHRQR